jgi:hypothetical protein
MFELGKRKFMIALVLMVALLGLGALPAQAKDTGGSDRLVKGAALGAAVGAVTQVVRGRTGGVELLKGAAVGASVGAAAGAYSDYEQEKDARIEAERDAEYARYDRGGYRGDRQYRRAYRNGHPRNHFQQAAHRRHGGRCRH